MCCVCPVDMSNGMIGIDDEAEGTWTDFKCDDCSVFSSSKCAIVQHLVEFIV